MCRCGRGGSSAVRFEWRAAEADGPKGVDWPEVGELHRHLVSWDEVALPDAAPLERSPLVHRGSGSPGPASAASGPRVVTEGEGAALEADDTRLVLDARGQPQELVLHGRSLLSGSSRLGIWRAPTDNDRATLGDSRVASRLKQAGLVDDAIEPLGPLEVSCGSGGAAGGSGGSRSVDETASAAVLVGIPGALRIKCRWLIDRSGDVPFDLAITGELELPELLRLGFEFDLGAELDRVEWYGPGPGESYSDRTGGLFVARHSSTVADGFFPYAIPQETGNHTEVRWLALQDQQKSGLVAIGDPTFDGAALPVDIAALEAASHPHRIVWPGHTVLRLDAIHSGLGTASCGPGVAERYQIHARARRTNRIVLRPVGIGEDPGVVAQRRSALRRHQRWRY